MRVSSRLNPRAPPRDPRPDGPYLSPFQCPSVTPGGRGISVSSPGQGPSPPKGRAADGPESGTEPRQARGRRGHSYRPSERKGLPFAFKGGGEVVEGFGHREGEEGIPANLGGSLPRRFGEGDSGRDLPGEGTEPGESEGGGEARPPRSSRGGLVGVPGAVLGRDPPEGGVLTGRWGSMRPPTGDSGGGIRRGEGGAEEGQGRGSRGEVLRERGRLRGFSASFASWSYRRALASRR